MSYTLQDYYMEAGLLEYPAWASEVALSHPNVPDFRPRWTQVSGLNLAFAYDNLRSGLFDDMGTGKTLPSQGFALWHAGQGNRCLAVMPRVLLGQYEKSFYTTFPGFEKHVRCEVYYGKAKQRTKQAERWRTHGAPEIVITTYDILRDEFALFRALEFNALILDECKILGNENNSTYIAAQLFLGPIGERYCMVLNGTPLKNQLTNAYGYINFLTPGMYKNRIQFDINHVIYQRVKTQVRRKGSLKDRMVEVIAGYRQLDMLHDYLYLQARRVDKSELDLPPLTQTPIYIDLEPEHINAYQKLVRERLLFTDQGVIDATATATRRSLAAKAVAHLDELNLTGVNNAMLEACDELLEEADVVGTNKVFILAHYQKTIEMLAKHYKHLNPAVIYGKTRDSGAQADKFKNDPSCRVCIANYASGGVGLNFQDVCHIGVCFEPSTVPGDHDQAVARLHRGGQMNNVTLYLLIARGTLYVKMYKDRLEKTDLISRVMNPGAWERELLGAED